MWNIEGSRNEATVTVMCDLRQQLVEEGWRDVEELRKELVAEMNAVRAARARRTQSSRSIKIQLEPSDDAIAASGRGLERKELQLAADACGPEIERLKDANARLRAQLDSQE